MSGDPLLALLPERLQGEFWSVPMVGMVTAAERCDAAFVTTNGSIHLVAGEGASRPMRNAPVCASQVGADAVCSDLGLIRPAANCDA